MPAPYKIHEKISANDGDVSAAFNVGPKGVNITCTATIVGGDLEGTVTLEGCNDPARAADKDTAWAEVTKVVDAVEQAIIEFDAGVKRFMRYRFRFAKKVDATGVDCHLHRWKD